MHDLAELGIEQCCQLAHQVVLLRDGELELRRLDGTFAGLGIGVDVFELGERERLELELVPDGNVELPTVLGKHVRREWHHIALSDHGSGPFDSAAACRSRPVKAGPLHWLPTPGGFWLANYAPEKIPLFAYS